jgi:hypothetical protein
MQGGDFIAGMVRILVNFAGLSVPLVETENLL